MAQSESSTTYVLQPTTMWTLDLEGGGPPGEGVEAGCRGPPAVGHLRSYRATREEDSAGRGECGPASHFRCRYGPDSRTASTDGPPSPTDGARHQQTEHVTNRRGTSPTDGAHHQQMGSDGPNTLPGQAGGGGSDSLDHHHPEGGLSGEEEEEPGGGEGM